MQLQTSCSHLKTVMIMEASNGDAVGNNMVAVCLSLSGTVLSRILPSIAFVSDISFYDVLFSVDLYFICSFYLCIVLPCHV